MPLNDAPNSTAATNCQLRDALLSAMTHDLRSPLGAVSIFCEILMMGKDKLDDQQVQNLGMITEATSKAQKIIDDAGDLARLYKGTMTLDVAPIDLEDLVQECTGAFQQALEQKQVGLRRELAPALHVNGDPQKTRLVVLRLLEEALAVAPRGGEITVTANPAEPVTLSITCPGQPGTESRRPPPENVKGRLGNRKPTDTPYSLTACGLVMEQMGGSLTHRTPEGFAVDLRFKDNL